MDKLKVCLLIPDFPICTGVNTQALNLALNLNKLGTQSFLVFSLNTAYNLHKPCYDKSYEEKLAAAGIPVYQKPGDMRKKWASYKFYLKLFWRLQSEYQLVYISGVSNMICWFTLFFKLLGKKVVIKMTGMNINDPITLQRHPHYSWLPLKLLTLADRFVGTSTSLCNAYRESPLFPDSKLVQIPNGVDTAVFTPLLEQAKNEDLKKKLKLPPGLESCIWSWSKAAISASPCPGTNTCRPCA